MKAIEELEAGQLLMLNNVRMDEQETSVKGDLAAMSETTSCSDSPAWPTSS